LVSHTKVRTQTEGVWEQGAEEEVAGGWRRLHNEELHNWYASQTIIRVIKARRMGGVGHVAHMGEM
jgi:hypothetical protein